MGLFSDRSVCARLTNEELRFTPPQLLEDYYLSEWLPSTMSPIELLPELLDNFLQIKLHSQVVSNDFVDFKAVDEFLEDLKRLSTVETLTEADADYLSVMRDFAARFWIKYENSVLSGTAFVQGEPQRM